jgi:hypothetical protein
VPAGTSVSAWNTTSTVPSGATVIEEKNALDPGTLPATTGVDQVSPPSVDLATKWLGLAALDRTSS